LILAPFGGEVADRVDKRKLIAATRLGVAGAIFFIAAVVFLGRVAVWHLFVATLVIGAAFSFDVPARQTIVMDLVSREELMSAIGLGYVAMDFASIAGPALAGYSIGRVGVAGAFGVAGVSYGLAALLMLVIPRRALSRGRGSSALRGIAAGVSYASREPRLSALLTMATGFTIFGSALYGLMPVFARDVFRVGAAGLGLLGTMNGVGALVGSLIIASLGSFRRRGKLLVVLGLLTGAALIVFVCASSFPLSLLLMVLVGLARGSYMTLSNALIQTSSSDAMRGRIMGLYMMVWGLQSLSFILLGKAADAVGAPLTVGASGGMLILIVAMAALLRPQLRELT